MPKTSGTPVMIASGSNSPSGIATDGANVYWSEFVNPGTIRKVSVNGGTVTVLGHNANNIGVAIDPTSTNVYWGEDVLIDAGKIDFAPTAGGPTTSLVTGRNNIWDVATDGASVFWVENSSSGIVGQVAVGGGAPAILANNLAGPVALALDESNVYWIENAGATSAGTLNALPKLPTVQVTVGTNPSGLTFQVDGTNYPGQQTFTWLQGSSHSIGTTGIQGQGTGVQLLWSNWSDGGQQSHMVVPEFNSSYTANFSSQYYLTTSASQGGAISPPSGWYNAGTTALVSATPSNGYYFVGFSGSLTGTAVPQSVLMNAPLSISATFSAVAPGSSRSDLASKRGNRHLDDADTGLGSRELAPHRTTYTWAPHLHHPS